MEKPAREAIEGNEAAARVAYALSDVIAIYPITPSSPMGELADAWMGERRPNLWGAVPLVVEMQSEGGAAGALHGAVTTGSLGTTFTSSQGLLLMIPNMYKIAGELTPAVIHVAARAIATHALSIFGDHSDVMAARQTGWGMLASSSVQEAHDFACVAHAATLRTRLPFVHFFDGFRTSHEIQKIDLLAEGDLRALVDDEAVRAHRGRGLTPDRPSIRGTAQNPDVFFQAREAANPFYAACPGEVEAILDRFAERTGRRYRLFDYHGAPDAERVIVLMGSAAGAAEEAVEALCARGEKVGLVKVRLYRPFASERLLETLPATVRSIAVLDRTKEPGAVGEPLYQDVVTAMAEAGEAALGVKRRAGEVRSSSGPPRTLAAPRIIGGRYGLGSKEFTASMAAAVFAELARPEPKRHFTIGIVDDVTGASLAWDRNACGEPPDTVRAVFFGLGADGTVGANKNSIKIIASWTDLHAQGYFVYDSKKAGSVTVSHLRFGPRPIRSTYLVQSAGFVACHHEHLLATLDVLGPAEPGGTFLLNTSAPPDKVWGRLPAPVRRTLAAKRLRLFVIDADAVAKGAGLGRRINTVMQAAFFALARVLPLDQAIAAVKQSIARSYGRKSDALVTMNQAAVDASLKALHEVTVPSDAGAGETHAEGAPTAPPGIPENAPEFVQRVIAALMAGRGDLLPVSALPVDGTFPAGTARFEKRNIAQEIPAWDETWCIQCNKCAIVCPHAAIRVKAYPAEALDGAPQGFKCMPWKGSEFPPGTRYTVQVAPEDCTGCGLCVEVCPAKNKKEARFKAINMVPAAVLRAGERKNFDFFLALPEADRRLVNGATVKGSQFLEPLFEFSGACAGCGETPYLKLLTQLFGDRLLVANATGCSSIYGGNLPTTPWTTNRDGRGPAWSNSLFEDNAEFGLGFRLSLDQKRDRAQALLRRQSGRIGDRLADAILSAASQRDEAGLARLRAKVAELKGCLADDSDAEAAELLSLADDLVRKTVWIVGGDGWAYDIGYGGLDHVLASGRDVNLLVLDTEVYSNTGGQASKATPRGAVAKFAAAGKSGPRKDLALIAAQYGGVYVARIAMGASDAQTVRALQEAESWPGPSLVIAYSHCIAHGFDLKLGMQQQKRAVDCGYWPLFRCDPREAAEGRPAVVIDSRPPKLDFKEYAYRETRYRMLAAIDPPRAALLLEEAEQDVRDRFARLERMAAPAAAGGSDGT
ncbi:MAG TPA: pyruvate:ferredoxin (flavodoxin) oxidoreductase [Candidatus Polarisedimenticolia bacterium]|nr:pyruvate:ferredoxin (flavodoxin) oxidoreductase [Candidatus Polarisedimenticolia bacterium]